MSTPPVNFSDGVSVGTLGEFQLEVGRQRSIVFDSCLDNINASRG